VGTLPWAPNEVDPGERSPGPKTAAHTSGRHFQTVRRSSPTGSLERTKSRSCSLVHGSGGVSPEGEEIYSATIITTDAGPDIEQIHNRQPVVLELETWERWLDPAVDADEELIGMLRPGPGGVLRHWPVSQRVGNVRNQGRQLTEALNSQ
jgi:putative SOS response-associated peptidase YedK